MGHRKKHAPRRGSLMFYPRVRSSKLVARIRSWPSIESETPRLLGFAAYKAGCTHAVVVEDRPKTPLFGREIVKAVTILDAPPLMICGFRAYIKTEYGLKTLTEVWTQKFPEGYEKYISRVLTLPKDYTPEPALKAIEANLDKIAEFRVIAATQPRKSGLGKKTPEIFEIKVGGGKSIQEVFEYVKSLLGKEVRVSEVFSEGQLVDVVSVTKGKGFQGVVKRFGVKILPKWHKHRKGHRVVGAISPGSHKMVFAVPRPGQVGCHQRTEYNKRILKIGENGAEVTPKGGFLHYGVVKGDYIVIEGSLPGPAKRLVRLRYPIRPPKEVPEGPPKVLEVNLESKQGA